MKVAPHGFQIYGEDAKGKERILGVIVVIYSNLHCEFPSFELSLDIDPNSGIEIINRENLK